MALLSDGICSDCTGGSVSGCSVVGCADKDHVQGRLPLAYIVLKGDCGKKKKQIVRELRGMCADELPEYVLPVGYKFIDKRSMLTEINDIGEHVSTEKLVELLSMVRNLSSRAGVTVIAGSLPRGVDPAYYRDLVKTVDPHSLKIVDTEGAKLFSALEAEVDLVKPNLEELQETLGREFKDRDDMLSGCREILDRGAKAVLLSLGKDGAVITNGSKNYYCRSINVAVNSTVGAGDGMVAAAAVKMQEGADLPEILRAGVAAGTATVTTFGTISFTREKYEEIYRNLLVTEF